MTQEEFPNNINQERVTSPQITARMDNYNHTSENAQNRISELFAEIGKQLSAINSISDSSEVDDIIAEQEKSDYIYKQAQLIDGFLAREANDDRDEQIAKLQSDLEKARKDAKYYSDLWYKRVDENKLLRSAIKAIVEVLPND